MVRNRTHVRIDFFSQNDRYYDLSKYWLLLLSVPLFSWIYHSWRFLFREIFFPRKFMKLKSKWLEPFSRKSNFFFAFYFSDESLFLELECSYSPDTGTLWINSWIANMNKVQSTVQTPETRTFMHACMHTCIQIAFQKPLFIFVYEDVDIHFLG
jgi:hypothetical protein